MEEGGGRVVHTYSGNRVTIDVLPRGPLTLLIIRSITIKQGIHTDRAYNWLTMAQHVKDDNPSTGRTRKGQDDENDEDDWFLPPFSNFSPEVAVV